MLEPDTPVDPYRLKEAQPGNFARLMDCLRADAPAYVDLIEDDGFVQGAIDQLGAKLRIRFGDLPRSAQQIIQQAADHAKQKAAKND